MTRYGLPSCEVPPSSKPSDVRVIEHREDLPLRPEALHDVVRAQERIDHLDRDFLREALVVACRAIDDTHPALSDLLEDPVGADPITRRRSSRRVNRRRIEDGVRRLVCREQRSHFGGERRLPFRDLSEERVPLFGIELDRLLKCVRDSFPLGRAAPGAFA
jgi:hypothetical protein